MTYCYVLFINEISMLTKQNKKTYTWEKLWLEKVVSSPVSPKWWDLIIAKPSYLCWSLLYFQTTLEKITTWFIQFALWITFSIKCQKCYIKIFKKILNFYSNVFPKKKKSNGNILPKIQPNIHNNHKIKEWLSFVCMNIASNFGRP